MKSILITSLILCLTVSIGFSQTRDMTGTTTDKTATTTDGTATNTTTDPILTKPYSPTVISDDELTKLRTICTSGGVETTKCQLIFQSAETAAEKGVSPREVRRIVKELIGRKVDAEKVAIAVKSISEAVDNGIPQKEARSLVATTVLRAHLAGLTGTELVQRIKEVIAIRKERRQERLGTTGANKPDSTAQGRVKEVIKQRVDDTGGSVSPAALDKKLKPRR